MHVSKAASGCPYATKRILLLTDNMSDTYDLRLSFHHPCRKYEAERSAVYNARHHAPARFPIYVEKLCTLDKASTGSKGA